MLKTIAQTVIATIGTAAALDDVNWVLVASAAALAGMLSLLTGVAGFTGIQKRAMNYKNSRSTADRLSEGIRHNAGKLTDREYALWKSKFPAFSDDFKNAGKSNTVPASEPKPPERSQTLFSPLCKGQKMS